MSTRRFVKLLQVCRMKVFSPRTVSNRNFHSFRLLNVPIVRRNNVRLTSMDCWYNQSPTLLTNYTNLHPTYAYVSTSTPTTPVTDDFKIIPINKADTERVLQFLRRFFFRDEPLQIEQNLFRTPKTIYPELEEMSMRCIDDEVSFMATAPNGDILGVCLNGLIIRSAPKEKDIDCRDKNFAKVLKFLKALEENANVFGRYPDVNRVFYMNILSIHSSYRGSGISEAFVERNWALAREHNCTLMRGDCTSFYAARMLARLEFDCIYRLKYEDYKEDGKPVFNPEPPHVAAAVYIRRLT